MERELTLTTLTLSACGSTLIACGAMLPRARRADDGRELERRCGSRVWAPFAAALVPFAVLLGWSSQEPDITGEAIGPVVRGVALLFGAIWMRALLRAVASLVAARRTAFGAARTVGMLRPRIVIDPQLVSRLDEAEQQAVVAHERAHARHRDPLRLWLAQLVTDLQWPLPGAQERLKDWRRALEIARDEEARASGIAGEDLASAVLKAVRIGVERRAAVAGLVDEPLTDRIARLLAPVPVRRPRVPGRTLPAAFAVAITVAVVVGHAFGEAVFRSLPGVQH